MNLSNPSPAANVPGDSHQTGRTPPLVDKMSNYQRQDLLLKQITLVVQCFGFILVGLGLYNNSKSTDNSTLSSLTYWTFELHREFIRSPEMRHYFHEGKEIAKTDPSYDKAIAIAGLHTDVMDSMLHTRGTLPHAGWEHWLKDCFRHSPLMRQYLEENKDYYPQLWKQVQLLELERKSAK